MKAPTLAERIDSRVESIEARLNRYRSRGLKMFATSSFQSNSVVLLHLLSIRAPEVPVFFLDTGYHFPETLQFRQEIGERFPLEVQNLRSEMSRLQQRDASQRLLFASDPEYCCYLNKVAPLEPVLAGHDVWISGVRAYQNSHRAALGWEENSRRGVVRYHPLLDWTAEMMKEYRRLHELPQHPLDGLGYGSVGCEPCTRRVGSEAGGDDRSGRWTGLAKTECGLNL